MGFVAEKSDVPRPEGPAILRSFRGVKEAAEKLKYLGEIGGEDVSAAKAGVDSPGFMRGLKPPPPSVRGFSAGSENPLLPLRFQSCNCLTNLEMRRRQLSLR